MSPPGGVSVALPIFRADPGALRCAVASIQKQTLTDLDILLVLNGADRATTEMTRGLAGADPRVRVVELPEPSLAAALNAALRIAKYPVVARMDGDDLCEPDRLERQARWLGDHPRVAALGTAFARISADNQVLGTVHPPCEASEIRWRLCTDNVFCHGSMMLRRDAVLAAGGYQTGCARAQDYELWLRLSQQADLANLPEVLYRYRVRDPLVPLGPDPEQARVAAEALVTHWGGLPSLTDPAARLRLEGALAGALGTESGGWAAAPGQIEAILNEGPPARETLIAWLLARWRTAAELDRVHQTCRRSRLREIGALLGRAGAKRLWVWGAGRHTRWLLPHAGDLGVPVAGLIDDCESAAPLMGLRVLPPSTLGPGEHVLLSSDCHEDQMWRRSEPLRARGVRVWRMYDDGAGP